MGQSITDKLQSYITAELSHAELYRQLAKKTPDDRSKQILLEFSDNDHAHAVQFQYIYYHMTGQKFTPIVPTVTLTDNYRAILQSQAQNELRDYRKYAEQYQLANSSALKNAFFRAKTDKNIHSLLMLYLLLQ